jgi:hypothetical protein
VQTLMSFLETKPADAVEPVWPTLDPASRSEIVTMLARLIAKAAVRNEIGVDKEARDE